MHELEQLVLSRNLPLMVCGDFNSPPNSSVYELCSTRSVDPAHQDLQSDACHVLPPAEHITHELDLASVYHTVTGEEPLFTNFTVGFKGSLDYLWHTPSSLRPLAVVPVPDEDTLRTAGEALPNCLYSSDHILLCADMQLGGSTGAEIAAVNNGVPSPAKPPPLAARRGR